VEYEGVINSIDSCHLEKLIIVELVKKFLALYGTGQSITMFIRAATDCVSELDKSLPQTS
jgi:hypothetical protein